MTKSNNFTGSDTTGGDNIIMPRPYEMKMLCTSTLNLKAPSLWAREAEQQENG